MKTQKTDGTEETENQRPTPDGTKEPEMEGEAKPSKPEPRTGRKGGRRIGPIPEDPEALCCLVIVESTFAAKIIYHYLKVGKRFNFSYLNYCHFFLSVKLNLIIS